MYLSREHRALVNQVTRGEDKPKNCPLLDCKFFLSSSFFVTYHHFVPLARNNSGKGSFLQTFEVGIELVKGLVRYHFLSWSTICRSKNISKVFLEKTLIFFTMWKEEEGG